MLHGAQIRLFQHFYMIYCFKYDRRISLRFLLLMNLFTYFYVYSNDKIRIKKDYFSWKIVRNLYTLHQFCDDASREVALWGFFDPIITLFLVSLNRGSFKQKKNQLFDYVFLELILKKYTLVLNIFPVEWLSDYHRESVHHFCFFSTVLCLSLRFKMPYVKKLFYAVRCSKSRR